MGFNDMLWSIHSKVIQELQKDTINKFRDTLIYDDLPSSTKVFIKHFKQIINDYRILQEIVDLSTSNCSSPQAKTGHSNSLYLKLFTNGVSSVLQNIDEKLASIEESFITDESVTLTKIFNHFECITDILPNLILAGRKVKEDQYRGCRVLDLCENFIMKGSPTVGCVFMKIQQTCIKNFYLQTKLWVMHTELYDPHNEFFIKVSKDSVSDLGSYVNQSILSQTASISKECKYEVDAENLPCLIPFSVATKILFIGEALLICQHNEIEDNNEDRLLHIYGISEHTITARFAEIEKSSRFNLRNFSSLIDDLWVGVNKYIRKKSDEVGNVEEQLWLMWEMYLLGRGELFQEFLLRGSNILDSDVTTVDSRRLNLALSDAFFYVYQTEDSEIMKQFFFKLPNRKAMSRGFPAWPFMSLECKIKWPLHYLFTEEVMKNYNYLFHFLLKLKRAEMTMTPTWKSINSLDEDTLKRDLNEMRIDLLAVIRNLINYCFTHVISEQMDDLMVAVKNAVMFTDLQKALSIFLSNISNCLFLTEQMQSFEGWYDSDVNPIIKINNTPTFSQQNTMNWKVSRCFKTLFTLCGAFPKLLDRRDDGHFRKIASFKKTFYTTFEDLFTLLGSIDAHDYTNGNLYTLVMCLDYNRFFCKKFVTSDTEDSSRV